MNISKYKIDFRILYFSILLVFLLLFNYDNGWNFFLNFVKFGSWSVYGDLRLLLKGIDLYRIGKDPFLKNYDPPYNYPSSWKMFSFLSFFNSGNYKIIGFVMIVFSQLLFLQATGIWENFKKFVFYTFILVSPVSLLIFERANNDLIVFCIILLGVLFRKKTILLLLFFLISIVLKIYPLGLFLTLLFLFNLNNKKNAAIFLVGVVGVFYYLFLIKDELMMIRKNTPVSIQELSYGYSIIIENIIMRNPSMEKISWIYHLFFSVIVFSLLYWFLKKNFKKLKEFNSPDMNKEIILFLSGAGIFFFSYVFTISWEYRLFFLILCLPAVLKWNSSNIFGTKVFLWVFVLVFWNQSIKLYYEKWISSNSNNVFFFNQILILVLFFLMILYTLKIFSEKPLFSKTLKNLFK